MKKRIISINGGPVKTNSSFGRYAVSCTFEFTYDNGVKRTMNGQELFWRVADARKFCKQLEAVTA